MPRVAPHQLVANRGVRSLPETGQIGRHLHVAPVRREQMKHERHAPFEHPRRLGVAKEILQAALDPGGLLGSSLACRDLGSSLSPRPPPSVTCSGASSASLASLRCPIAARISSSSEPSRISASDRLPDSLDARSGVQARFVEQRELRTLREIGRSEHHEAHPRDRLSNASPASAPTPSESAFAQSSRRRFVARRARRALIEHQPIRTRAARPLRRARARPTTSLRFLFHRSREQIDEPLRLDCARQPDARPPLLGRKPSSRARAPHRPDHRPRWLRATAPFGPRSFRRAARFHPCT